MVTPALLLSLSLVTVLPAVADPIPPSPPPPPYGTADPALDEEVASVARRVEALRGRRFRTVPVAARLGEEPHRARLASEPDPVSPERLAARGRAWEDLGLGDAGAPAELARLLRRDLDGISVDPAGRLVRVEPWVFPAEDLAPKEGEEAGGSALLLATGVRPDGPALAHVLTHALALQSREDGGAGAAAAEETTDALLARRAWAEGEAGLTAVRYLFEAMGLEDEILSHEVDLGELAGGRLLPSSLASAREPVRALLSFVYEEGFAQAAGWHRRGGSRALAAAEAGRRATRDVMHPERAVPPATTEGELPKAPGGHRLADRDRLGEQGIVVLVSSGTGKDNLGLLAGDGWAGDDLLRFEPEGKEAAAGVTLWRTRWTTPEEAAEFEDAYRRLLEVRHGEAPRAVEGAPGRFLLAAGGRKVRVDRREREVVVRVAPDAIDAALEGGKR